MRTSKDFKDEAEERARELSLRELSTDYPRCVVNGCDGAAVYFDPNDWCEIHWDMWWHWPSYKEDEPDWMKERNA